MTWEVNDFKLVQNVPAVIYQKTQCEPSCALDLHDFPPKSSTGVIKKSQECLTCLLRKFLRNFFFQYFETFFEIQSIIAWIVNISHCFKVPWSFSWQHPKCIQNVASCDTRKIRKIQNKSQPTKPRLRNVWSSVGMTIELQAEGLEKNEVALQVP